MTQSDAKMPCSSDKGGFMTFNQQIYQLVRQIPAGQVTTYGTLAMLCGKPRASRAVGWAMAQCPLADVPCHRVVNRLGRTAKAFPDQRRLLEAEGVRFRPDGSIDLKIFSADLAQAAKNRQP